MDAFFGIRYFHSAFNFLCRQLSVHSILFNIITMVIIQRINSINIKISPPLFSETRETTSCANDNGIVAMIPTIMRREIPLPIPLSVIFSPSHMAKMVPVTKIIITVQIFPCTFILEIFYTKCKKV